MKSVSFLTDFYYNDLYPTLQKLEKKRRDIKHRIIFSAIASTAVFTALAYTLQSYYEFIIFIYIALMALLYKFMIKDYTHEFKMSVIKPLIHAIDKTMLYSSQTHVSNYFFEHSKLFEEADKLSGNDYVKGQIDGINIQFSDIHAQNKNQDSKGKESWDTIFQGLFIVADFNKHFYGETVVLPDSAQNSFGNVIGHWLQSKNAAR
ncbi:MAG: Galanin, partial [Candidatus Magasanikbacteria bacterium]|nr:Galanin [Candidatus Magasanikbacteria bacterium]